jgi:hypothetical protein
MSQYDEQSDDRGFLRQVREVKEDAFRSRQYLRRQMPDPSIETKIEVAAALSDFRDLLMNKSRSSALSHSWESYDVDWIEEALVQTTQVERELPRRGRACERVDVPVAATVDAQELLQLGKRLDAIAEDLGWSAGSASGSDGIYSVSDMDSDDYDEPVSENVQKPQ